MRHLSYLPVCGLSLLRSLPPADQPSEESTILEELTAAEESTTWESTAEEPTNAEPTGNAYLRGVHYSRALIGPWTLPIAVAPSRVGFAGWLLEKSTA